MISHKTYNAIPDITLVCSIILAYLLDRYVPIIEIIPFPVNLIGWLIVAAGIGRVFYILAVLRSKHTATNVVDQPSILVQDGLYGLSRNPFYLSSISVVFGTAIVFGSLAGFAAPIVCFAVLHFIIVPVEENNLQKQFGKHYEQYKHNVRRWL